jgi:hypothetical protein
VTPLDSALALTRGSPLGPIAFLSQLNPRNGIYTAIGYSSEENKRVIGQVKCVQGRRSAQLTYITPHSASNSSILPVLFEGLAYQAGQWGACSLLAEVDERDPLFEDLRRAGFVVYGWQKIFALPFRGGIDYHQPGLWHFAPPEADHSIRHLYQTLVPPLMQAADPLPKGRLYGLIHHDNKELMAYVESIYGPEGIYLLPLIHPDVENVKLLLANLEGYLSPLLGRKVYLAVRSHQAWLEIALDDVVELKSSRQALMVKHLASFQRVAIANAHLAMIEETHAKASTPILKNYTNWMK